MTRTKIGLFACVLLALSACTVPERADRPESRKPARPVYFATVEDSGSRVYADPQLRLRWNAGDEISVFNTSANQRYVFDGNTGDSEGTFSAREDAPDGAEVPFLCAVYPYSPGTSFSEGVIGLDLPPVQAYAENSFAPGANPMLALSEDKDDELLYFKNLGGYLVIKLYGEGTIQSISLRSNGGEKLSGPGSVVPEPGQSPVLTMGETAGISVTLDCGEGVKLGKTAEDATAFWFVLPPVTLSQGFSVTVRNTEGRALRKSTQAERTISRNGKSTMAPFEASVFPISDNIIDFEDDCFKFYCVANFDTDGDGEITETEADLVTKIDVETDEIEDLSDLKAFKNLMELKAVPRHTGEYGVGIGEDWRGSGYTFDEYNGYNTVTIVKGKLAAVDVSGNPLLTRIDCSGNLLTSVDLSANGKLEYINLNYNNDLDRLVLGDKPSLKELRLTATSLTAIDLSAFPNLESLSLDRGADVGTLDLSHNPKLQRLGVDRRGLTSLDVSGNPLLYELSCALNDLTGLDVTHNPELEYLSFAYNRIEEIDLSANTRLGTLFLQNNRVRSIRLDNLTELCNVHIGNYFDDGVSPVNAIHEIDLTSNPKLERLFATILDIGTIDVSHNQKLEYIDCCYNGIIEELDVSDSPELNTLLCYGDPMLERIYISPGQNFSCSKDETAHFVYKGEGAPYASTDFSRDGTVRVLQTASAGNGIDLVLMGDAFTDRLIADGTYDRIMNETMEAFFSVEPYRSFRDLFNVYSVTVVSTHDTYDVIHETALSTAFGDGTNVGGDDGAVFRYAGHIDGFDADRSVVCVVMNKEAYAGTCYMYWGLSNSEEAPDEWHYNMADASGAAIAYFPLGTGGDVFTRLVRHEAGGHGFAKLADEYFYPGGGSPTQEAVRDIADFHGCGWYTNIDTTADPERVLWHDFLADSRYQGLGVFEGAFLYETGVYRPTEDSIMNTNEGQYNAPSRQAIYNRIHKLAFGEGWEFDRETFVEYDAVNRTAYAPARRGVSRSPERPLPPLSAPVIRKMSWRDVKPFDKPAKAPVQSRSGAGHVSPNRSLGSTGFANGAVAK